MLSLIAPLLLAGGPVNPGQASQLPAPIAVARQTFYTQESSGEVVVELGSARSAKVDLKLNGRPIADDEVVGPGVARAPFPLAQLPLGSSELDCTVSPAGQAPWRRRVEVVRLQPKANEVKVDRLTGAFIADGLPLFPFGFYCYSPVQPTLPEEEFVRGFSMISPYQDIANTALADRQKYMDRCAELGMKVNYSLVSLSGGGSGTQLSQADKDKRKLLEAEVKTFRDHPALLSWYLSDEPDGQGVSPASLMEEYKIVRDLDPYHPIAMVFCVPSKAHLYKDALDVAMADPYPIPNSSPVDAGNTIAGLRKAFGLDKPLWVVPQAFGGNEWWAREPTPQEVRLMTWQSILNGASGVQYFVRHGLGAFPKSPSMWAECGKMAEEVFELEPYLHSTEAAPSPTVDVPTVQAKCWRANGSVLLALVNTANAPTAVHVRVDTSAATARLPFENRSVRVVNGAIDDFVDAYGTRFYELNEHDGIQINPADPMIDPGFEQNPTAGIPSGCYFNLGSDRGATARVDPRVFHSGRHSVRLIAPVDGGGLTLAFYPVSLAPGKSYRFQVWAKAMPGTHPKLALQANQGGASASFDLTSEWALYELPFTVPAGKDPVRVSTSLGLATKGTAWVDDVDVVH